MSSLYRNKIKVYRSLKGLHVCLLNESGATLAGGMYAYKNGSKPIVQSQEFGRDFAKKVISKRVKKVSFLRGKSIYHGRVKAFAEGLREGGLEF